LQTLRISIRRVLFSAPSLEITSPSKHIKSGAFSLVFLAFLLHQIHLALGAFSCFVFVHFGVHGAGVIGVMRMASVLYLHQILLALGAFACCMFMHILVVGAGVIDFVPMAFTFRVFLVCPFFSGWSIVASTCSEHQSRYARHDEIYFFHLFLIICLLEKIECFA